MNEDFKTFIYNMQILSYSNLFYFIRARTKLLNQCESSVISNILLIYIGSIGASSVELEWRGRGMNYTLEWKLNGDDIW